MFAWRRNGQSTMFGLDIKFLERTNKNIFVICDHIDSEKFGIVDGLKWIVWNHVFVADMYKTQFARFQEDNPQC